MRPDDHMVDVEIVIQARNEEHRLPAALATTLDCLRNQPYSARVTVVDNGSVDRTLDFGGNNETPVRTIACARTGKGAAVRIGMLNANASHVGFMDADLATPLSALRDVITA